MAHAFISLRTFYINLPAKLPVDVTKHLIDDVIDFLKAFALFLDEPEVLEP